LKFQRARTRFCDWERSFVGSGIIEKKPIGLVAGIGGGRHCGDRKEKGRGDEEWEDDHGEG